MHRLLVRRLATRGYICLHLALSLSELCAWRCPDGIRGVRATWRLSGYALGVLLAPCAHVVAGAEATQRGALLPVMCLHVGRFSQCAAGIRKLCSVVGVEIFGFRTYASA